MSIQKLLHDALTNFVSRRFLARLSSTFICSLLIVIRPVSILGGQFVFLTLTIKELVFPVQESLAQQLEITILNLMGGLSGIGLSMLASYFAHLSSTNSDIARMVPALFLISICFCAGWLKSRLPRLAASARIACFISVWITSLDVGVIQSVRIDALKFLWVICAAATSSLLSGLLFLRWSSPQFAEDVAAALSELHRCLNANLQTAWSRHLSKSFPLDVHDHLLEQSISLNAVYSQVSFELRIGRLSVKYLRPLLGTVEHLRRELSWGLSFPKRGHSASADEINMIEAFRVPALELGDAILASMKAVEHLVLASFQYTIFQASLRSEKMELDTAKTRLSTTLVVARNELLSICDRLDSKQRGVNGEAEFPQEIFDLCLFTLSLLQMAHEMRHAVCLSERIISTYENSSNRLWHPRISWAWLGVQPRTIILEERGNFLGGEETYVDSRSFLSVEETLQGLAEVTDHVHSFYDSNNSTMQDWSLRCLPISPARIWFIVTYIWHYPRVLRLRLHLSRGVRSISHSPHLRYALKNAIGVALLSLPAFLPQGSTGRRWFISVHGQWMVTSFVWVLETNSGATWRVGYLRLSGTVIGAIYAYVVWVIAGTNPYGLVVMVLLAEIPISWIVINTTFPSLGVVASITLPPLIFAQYLHPDPPISSIELALLRGLMISGGIIAAVVMNSVVFPRHCRVMFLDNTSQTIRLLSQLYMGMSRELFNHSHLSTPVDKHKTLKLELRIRNALHRMSILVTTMNDELSLVPKPMRHYREVVRILQKLLDLMTGLRKIMENIPRKDTVVGVVAQRREFVSSVCMSLFACEQVFSARQPLPQFLPSSRSALNAWEKSVSERMRQTQQNSASPTVGLSRMYAFAEVDILSDLIDTLEELIALTRQLFGTSSWFDQPLYLEIVTMMSI